MMAKACIIELLKIVDNNINENKSITELCIVFTYNQLLQTNYFQIIR